MDDVRALLATATRWLRPTRDEVAAVRRYQSLDDQHEHLNGALNAARIGWMSGPLYDVVVRLDALLERATVPCDLVTYRGVPDVDEDVPALPGEVVTRRPYLSTTLDPDVARREFAVGPRPGVLRIVVREGANGLWVPPVGRKELVYEEELLLPRYTSVRYGRQTCEGGAVVVHCEVTP